MDGGSGGEGKVIWMEGGAWIDGGWMKEGVRERGGDEWMEEFRGDGGWMDDEGTDGMEDRGEEGGRRGEGREG